MREISKNSFCKFLFKILQEKMLIDTHNLDEELKVTIQETTKCFNNIANNIFHEKGLNHNKAAATGKDRPLSDNFMDFKIIDNKNFANINESLNPYVDINSSDNKMLNSFDEINEFSILNKDERDHLNALPSNNRKNFANANYAHKSQQPIISDKIKLNPTLDTININDGILFQNIDRNNNNNINNNHINNNSSGNNFHKEQQAKINQEYQNLLEHLEEKISNIQKELSKVLVKEFKYSEKDIIEIDLKNKINLNFYNNTSIQNTNNESLFTINGRNPECSANNYIDNSYLDTTNTNNNNNMNNNFNYENKNKKLDMTLNYLEKNNIMLENFLSSCDNPINLVFKLENIINSVIKIQAYMAKINEKNEENFQKLREDKGNYLFIALSAFYIYKNFY